MSSQVFLEGLRTRPTTRRQENGPAYPFSTAGSGRQEDTGTNERLVSKSFLPQHTGEPPRTLYTGKQHQARMRGPAGHHLPGVAPMNSSPDEGGGVVFGGAAYAILGMDYEIGLSLALGRMGGRR